MMSTFTRRGVRLGMNDDDVIVSALAEYLEKSLEQEQVLRGLLDKAGYNDSDRTVEECFTDLVEDFHILAASRAPSE